MSARIIDFPSETGQLEIEGYTLIAWRNGCEGDVWGNGEPNWLYGLWKPTNGKGWYESGYYVPAIRTSYVKSGVWPGHLNHSRNSRSAAIAIWRLRFREPYRWHYLMSEAAAFPEKHRQYMRPPRISVMNIPDMIMEAWV